MFQCQDLTIIADSLLVLGKAEQLKTAVEEVLSMESCLRLPSSLLLPPTATADLLFRSVSQVAGKTSAL